jgi:hypothetical protein
MSGINLILLFVAFFGFLPLAIILFKRKRVKKILSVGLPARAIVYDVRAIPRSASESVCYKFTAQNSMQQYSGTLTIKVRIKPAMCWIYITWPPIHVAIQ